jgi:hypothetical protein
VFTGTISGDSISLKSPSLIAGSSEVMTITGTARNGTNLDATFHVDGANSTDPCYGTTGKYGATGTVSGLFVPPVTGTWSGTVVETDNDPDTGALINAYPVDVTATITQATTPDSNVNFPLSGTVTFTNSLCFPDGVPVPVDSGTSYMEGNEIRLDLVDNDGLEILFSNNNATVTGADPYYSGPEGYLYLYANPSTPIFGGTCGEFQWSGTLTNP